MKRVEDYKSVSDLGLTARTLKCLERRKCRTVDEIALYGRRAAIRHAKTAEPEKLPKWELKLVKALDNAGLIRHDLFPRTWQLWGLYSDTTSVLDCHGVRVPGVVEKPLTSNHGYEEVQAVTDEQHEQLMAALKNIFATAPGWLKAVLRAYNPDDALIRPDARRRIERIRRQESLDHAMSYLRKHKYDLPPLFGWQSKRPDLTPESKLALLIEYDMPVGAYNYLTQRAGATTVGDIMNATELDLAKRTGWAMPMAMAKKTCNAIRLAGLGA